jgi:hypothetical protein
MSLCMLFAGVIFACGTTGQLSPDVTMITHLNTANLEPNTPSPVTVTASCGQGETLVSGGYYLVVDLNAPVQDVIRASFPSDAQGSFSTSPTAWTVQADTSLAGGVTAQADCITATFPVSVQAVAQPGQGAATSSTALCPPNSAVTGGGFLASDTRIRQSAPSQNGTSWTASYSPVPDSVLQPITAYAVCLLSAHLIAAPSASTVVTIPSDPNPGPCRPQTIDGISATFCDASSQAGGQVACGSGQIEVGGGFGNIAGRFYSDLPPGVSQSSPDIEGFLLYQDDWPPASSWRVSVQTSQSLLQGKAGSAGSVTIYGACLSIKVV